MADDRKAAIDAIREQKLNEVTAADFLEALTGSGLSPQHLRMLSDKKKFELLTEPENLGDVPVKDLIQVLNEKKKVELEKPPWAEGIQKRGREDWERDPRDLARDPDFIRDLAREVADQLRFRR